MGDYAISFQKPILLNCNTLADAFFRIGCCSLWYCRRGFNLPAGWRVSVLLVWRVIYGLWNRRQLHIIRERVLIARAFFLSPASPRDRATVSGGESSMPELLQHAGASFHVNIADSNTPWPLSSGFRMSTWSSIKVTMGLLVSASFIRRRAR